MLKPPCILLVDDEPGILAAMKDVLVPLGYEVVCTEDPLVALEIAGAQQIDIVITDINMPGMDGIELLQRLKKARPLLQVIMITAFSTMEKIQACLEAGAIDYLLKPLNDMEEVVTIIEEAARRVKRWRRNFLATIKSGRDKG